MVRATWIANATHALFCADRLFVISEHYTTSLQHLLKDSAPKGYERNSAALAREVTFSGPQWP